MGLAGVVSSKLLTLSTWFRFADGEGGTLLVGGAGATEYVKLSSSTSTGKLTFALKNSAAATIWSVTTSLAYDDDAVHHLGLSVSLGASRGQFFVDGDSVSVVTNTALTDDTIAFASATEWVVGADLGGATPLTGNFYDLAFWPGVSIDLTDSDDLNLIVAVDEDQGLTTDPRSVKPVGYGPRGHYLGEDALIIFNGAFEQNRGAGGLFLRTGNVGEDSAEESAPSGYRFFPRWNTPGERWFPSEQSGDPYPRSETFVETREGLTSYGKRLGLDEMDATTRRERPGFNFSDLILGIDEEDDEQDWTR